MQLITELSNRVKFGFYKQKQSPRASYHPLSLSSLIYKTGFYIYAWDCAEIS